MTGFGTSAADVEGTHYSVELRSINNKFFKATIRLPEELSVLEPELESMLARRLTRGSVTLTARYSDTSAAAAAAINTAALDRYLQQLLGSPGLAKGLGHDAVRVDLGALLALPGVVVADTGEARVESARPALLRLAEEACDRLVAMRAREGRSLHEALHTLGDGIAGRLTEIAEAAPRVVEQYQERLRVRINALLAESGTLVRDEDLLREVAVYAERSDVAEEIVRLQSHLGQFRQIIDDPGGEPAGRTLDFLAQEMLREANTIGSKSSDAGISRRIVEIKGAIDRIKEQAANVE
ncbi:MAG TPA: YicC family protein [Phycisphaerales bacterium]|nr:YicC family protein [Phycisphaerales bacterium]HMP37626.1 YicC family protein [Phycisphaerales bacterium]